jgi:negative regulator of sigma-B (phosphoserine phosphatase)
MEAEMSTQTQSQRRRSGITWGLAQRAIPGEDQCGDSCVVLEHAQGCLLAVADGLGHGTEAAAAARLAMQVLRENPRESVIRQLRLCHEALRQTRGAVLSVAALDYGEDVVTWAGVGNVSGVLVRHAGDGERPQLLCRSGVVGVQLPNLYAGIIPIAAGDLLMLFTDGMRPECADEFSPWLAAPQRIADDLLRGWSKDNDDALVLAARYAGSSPP